MKNRKPVRYWGVYNEYEFGIDVYSTFKNAKKEFPLMVNICTIVFLKIFGPFPKNKIFRFEVTGRVIK